MKKFKEKYKKEFLSTFEPENRLDEIKAKLEFKEQEKQKSYPHRRVFIVSSCGILLAAIILLLFLFIGDSKNIPVYQKMEAFNLLSNKRSIGIIDSEINPSNNEDIDYYVKKNEELRMAIYIHNPEQYEILSFTISGIKYQSYQFEEGSTGEVVYIDIKVDFSFGEYDLFIDELKYIDGDKIKNARYDGDRTYTLGVGYEYMPKVVENNISSTIDSIQLDFSLNDINSVISDDTFYRAYLMQDEKIIQKKDLKKEINEVIFTNLDYDSEYRVVITCAVDMYDGLGFRMLYLYDNTIKTLSGITRLDVISDYEGLEVVYQLASSDISVVGAKLYYGENVIKETIGSTIRFSNLSSNSEYRIEILYSYNNGMSIIEKSIFVNGSTKEYEVPNITGDILYINSLNMVILNLELIDDYGLSSISKIEVYGDNEFIGLADTLNSSLRFDKKYNSIIVKVYLDYDLHDGNGMNSTIITKIGMPM